MKFSLHLIFHGSQSDVERTESEVIITNNLISIHSFIPFFNKKATIIRFKKLESVFLGYSLNIDMLNFILKE